MKDILLLILVILVLSVVFFFNTKSLENFEGLLPPRIQKRTNISDSDDSPPLFNEADSVEQMYRLQRIYPFGGQSDYDVGKYPNVTLPGDVVGCGSRREPCYGGSQEVIGNILPPLDISNKNISPRNGHIGPTAPYEQIGYLYKIMAQYKDSNYRPLYLERLNPRNRYNRYRYFTLNSSGDKQNVIIPNVYRELGTNDQVKVEGEDYYYRVTINESNIPIYPRVSAL